MANSTQISDVRNTWEAAAAGWAAWEQAFSAGFVPATDALLDMAGVGTGARVLDLACGAGNQTLQAAARVGPRGAVAACDISDAMLQYVRRNADAAGYAHVSTINSAAEELPAMADRYDAAICRLGVMLFPDPTTALNAVRRTLKPAGRFAALVFTTPADNPFMAQPMAILLRHAGKQPTTSGRPGIFALGGENVLADLLADCGFADVETRTVRAPLELDTADDALEMIQQAFGAYRAVIADLGEDAQAAAWADVLDCLRQFEAEDGFRTELEFVIGAGAAAD